MDSVSPWTGLKLEDVIGKVDKWIRMENDDSQCGLALGMRTAKGKERQVQPHRKLRK